MKNIKVALAQTSSKIGNIEHNERYHLETLQKLNKNDNIDFVCFPELSLTGYLMKDIAYEVGAQCELALVRIAKKTRIGQRAIVGMVGKNRLGFIQNAAGVAGDGRLLGTTAKFYLPTYGLFEEMRYFVSGHPKNDLKTFESPACKFGVVICEDAWHPEPIEALARLGAEIVFCIASSPAKGVTKSNSKNELPIETQWMSLLKAHALMNSIFLVFVNRAGPEDEEYFWGGSAIVSPNGEVIARAKKYEPEIVVGEIRLDEIQRARRFSSFRHHNGELHEVLKDL